MRARTTLTTTAVACALAAGSAALLGAPSSGEDQARTPTAVQAAALTTKTPAKRVHHHGRWYDEHHPQHSSDDEPGPVAEQIPSFLRGVVTTSNLRRRPVAPGVRFTRWDQRDARGPIRAYLLTIDPSVRGLDLDVATNPAIRDTGRVIDLIGRDHAVAGVNGDFYDIGDTGAPLGVARDQQRGLLNARQVGWNSAFYLSRSGRPEIGSLALHARIKEHPDLDVTNLNSPFVKPGGIGIYTPRFGRTAGYRVVDGQRKQVRALVVRDHRVRSSRHRLPLGTRIRGTLLIGRGDGAKALRRIKVGSPAHVGWSLPQHPRMALTGNKFLVDDGVIRVVDDREMHPRTAVGIDRDTGEVLILAVDGRQSFSRGYTMVELADLMVDLGADEALNLDGGGSTTMVTRNAKGRARVVNSPSDGFQRSVANALEVTYHRP